MKRKLAVLLAMVMIVSVAGSCGSDNDSDIITQNNGASSGAEQSSSQVMSAAEEPYVCKIVSVGEATTEASDEVAARASEILMEKYNIKIELVRLGYGSFVSEVNLMLSSGEKLDLIPSFGISTITAANTGQILELTDLIEEHGSSIKEHITEGEWECVTFGGGIYAVPNNKEKAQGYGIAMRKDMLEAVDFDISTVTAEKDLEPLFELIKEAFPETYPLVSDRGQMGYHMVERDELGGDYGVVINPTNADRVEVVNYFETPEYEEVIQLHYEWSQKGYIIPDATTYTEDAGTLIGMGKGFAYYTNTKPGIDAEWERKVGKEMVVLELVSPFKTTSGVSNQWYIAHQSEDPEKAMIVLNEIYTNPELSDLLINGIEGQHYLRDEENRVLVFPEGVDASNTTYSSVAWVWPNELVSTPWAADGEDIWTLTDEFNKSAKEAVTLGFVWDNSAVLNEITACNNVKAKYENALNCGTLNPDEALPKLISELKNAGIDVIIAEKQKQVDAWLANR